jgi:hypothetical protein
MKIGTGIKVGGGVKITSFSILGDTDLAFNSSDFINQYIFNSNTLSVTFNANGTITAADPFTGPTRWFTTTPVASAYEIAVKATFLNINGIGTGVFSIAGVPQSVNVKSSYYSLTSGVTINATYTGYTPSSDEFYIVYDVFIRRTDLAKEITRSGNQMDIFPDT